MATLTAAEIEGEGVAAAYNAQKEAIGQQNVAIIKADTGNSSR